MYYVWLCVCFLPLKKSTQKFGIQWTDNRLTLTRTYTNAHSNETNGCCVHAISTHHTPDYRHRQKHIQSYKRTRTHHTNNRFECIHMRRLTQPNSKILCSIDIDLKCVCTFNCSVVPIISIVVANGNKKNTLIILLTCSNDKNPTRND